MKKQGKILVLLLSVLFILTAFSACGSGKKDAEKFVGTWKAEISMDETLNKEAAGDDMGKYMKFEGCSIAVFYTFDADGTYSVKVDRETVEDCLTRIYEAFGKGATEYLEEEVKNLGLDITLDDFLSFSGVTMDELLDGAMEAMAEVIEENIREFEITGKWEAENGKLYSTESVDEKIDKSEYDLYELNGDELKILGGEDEPDLVLVRQ